MANILKKVTVEDYCNQIKSLDPHSCYLWGGNGQLLSSYTEAKIRAAETSKANADRVIKMWNKNKGYPKARFMDCSGYNVWALRALGVIGASDDYTANGFKGWCKQISKSELKPGDWVFKVTNGKATHIGFVVGSDAKGNPIIYSSRGRDYNTPYVNETGWNWYGRPQGIYTESKKKGTPVSRNLKKGHKGEDVKAMQNALLALGYSFGKYGADGSFGAQTLKTLKAFQKNSHIKVDGIAGKNTIGLLASTGLVYWSGK